MAEEWRPVEGEPYEVSSRGRVRRTEDAVIPHGGISSKAGTLIKGRITAGGYRHVYISGRMVYVHRLVAEAFIPNPDGKPLVHHRDGHRDHNCVENLEWVTRSENLNYAWAEGCFDDWEPPRGEENGSSKLTEDDVRAIRARKEEGASLQAIADTFEISKGHASRIVRRESWGHVS